MNATAALPVLGVDLGPSVSDLLKRTKQCTAHTLARVPWMNIDRYNFALGHGKFGKACDLAIALCDQEDVLSHGRKIARRRKATGPRRELRLRILHLTQLANGLGMYGEDAIAVGCNRTTYSNLE